MVKEKIELRLSVNSAFVIQFKICYSSVHRFLKKILFVTFYLFKPTLRDWGI